MILTQCLRGRSTNRKASICFGAEIKISMSILQILFILLTILAISVGQILFKLAASSIEFSLSGLIFALSNYTLLTAMTVYFSATLMWLYVLQSTPLRVAYPFAALAFFFVPVLAHFLLGEAISWNNLAGAALIALGVCVSVLL